MHSYVWTVILRGPAPLCSIPCGTRPFLQGYKFQAIPVMHPYTGEEDQLRAIICHPEYCVGPLLRLNDPGYKHLADLDTLEYDKSVCNGLDALRYFIALFCPNLTDEPGINPDLVTILSQVKVARQPSLFLNSWPLRTAATKGATDKEHNVRFMNDLINEQLKLRVHPEVPPYKDLMTRSFSDVRIRQRNQGSPRDQLMPAILRTAVVFHNLRLEQPFDITDIALKYNQKGVEVVVVPRKVRVPGVA